MSHAPRHDLDEVDQLLLNARLRDELEPFLDESIQLLHTRPVPTAEENQFLESLLAWERAPVLPISQWFEPELALPRPETLDDPALHQLLWNTLEKLAERRVFLAMTDHLTDRQLYCLLIRDILPSLEKKLDRSTHCVHFHCLDPELQPDAWLRYYASPAERAAWAKESGDELPHCDIPPHPRQLPAPAEEGAGRSEE